MVKLIEKEYFGRALYALRRKLKMNQERMAAAIGVRGATVSRWESGLILPDPEHIDRICKEFGVSEDYFASEPAPKVDLPRLGQAVERAMTFVEAHSKPGALDLARKAASGDTLRELLVTLAALDDAQIRRYLAMIRAELDGLSGQTLKQSQKKTDNAR